ncbi:hypothetical protein ACFPRL_22025 [Pseudoclavibacter helvolus]
MTSRGAHSALDAARFVVCRNEDGDIAGEEERARARVVEVAQAEPALPHGPDR